MNLGTNCTNGEPKLNGMDLRTNRSGSRVGFRRIAKPAETLGEFRYLWTAETLREFRYLKPAETLGEFRYLKFPLP